MAETSSVFAKQLAATQELLVKSLEEMRIGTEQNFSIMGRNFTEKLGS